MTSDEFVEKVKHCENCGVLRDSEPLRSIRMIKGDRELLCKVCFENALDEQRVSSLDPRLPGENA